MRGLLLASAAFLAVGACNDGSTSADQSASPPDATAPQALPLADYTASAAVGDLYEIESSRLALMKSGSASVKDFAERMIADHGRTTDALKAFVQRNEGGLTLPSALDARRQGMIDQLQAARGDDFDRIYMTQQLAAHDEALALHRNFAERGDNEQARSLARTAVGVIEQHHELLRAHMSEATTAIGDVPSREHAGTVGATSSGNPTGAQTTTVSPSAVADTEKNGT